MSGMALKMCARSFTRAFQTRLPGLLGTMYAKETPSSRLVCSALRQFAASSVNVAIKPRVFLRTLPPGSSTTPYTAMKLLGNIVAGARNAPDNDWAYALFTTDAFSGGGGGWLVGHKQIITSLDFCSALLVSASNDGTCKVWNTTTSDCLQTLNHGNTAVNCMQVQGYTCVTGTSDMTASIWDLTSYTRKYVLQGHIAAVKCIAIDGNLVATGSEDSDCRIWSSDTGQCTHTLTGHTGEVRCLQLMNGILVTGSLDKSCISWDPQTGDQLQTFMHDAEVLALEFSGNTLATATNDNCCTIWDLRDGSASIRTFTGHTGAITCMRLQRDILVTGSMDGTLRLWNLKTGEGKIVDTYGCPVNRLVLRGNLVIVGLESGTICREDLSKHIAS